MNSKSVSDILATRKSKAKYLEFWNNALSKVDSDKAKFILLDDALAETISLWTKNEMPSADNSIACEKEASIQEFMQIIERYILTTGDAFHLVLLGDINGSISGICDCSCLTAIAEHVFAAEEIMSILCLSRMGGCSFDISDECKKYPVLQVESWGSFAQFVEVVAKEFGAIIYKPARGS